MAGAGAASPQPGTTSAKMERTSRRIAPTRYPAPAGVKVPRVATPFASAGAQHAGDTRGSDTTDEAP